MIATLLANWKLLAIAALLAALGMQTVRISSLKQEAAEQRAALAEATQRAEKLQRETEHRWQVAADLTAKAKDEAIENINARLADALGRLSDRPTRSAGGNLPTPACPQQNATGAGIFAEDAGFLVREAARADQLRAALAACYTQYEALTK